MLQGFTIPAWSTPLDVEERIRRTPEDSQVRGMFLQMLVDDATAGGKAAENAHYSAFVLYPMREYMRVAVDVARSLYGDQPLPAALHKLGSNVYPAFKRTMAGSALFSVAGNNFSRVSKLASKAYAISQTPGTVSTKSLGQQHILVQLRRIYNFPECLQVGVWEGALAACECQWQLGVRVHSSSDVDLEIEWSQ